MQPIKPNVQDGSGYPQSEEFVLCRRYIDDDGIDEPYHAYRILSWRGGQWIDRSGLFYGAGWVEEWVFLESAFETYNEINNN